MMKLLARIRKGQEGITGLETAIILIAFVVVAAVFAYTVLSAGIFSSQKSSESIYNGLKETQSTLQVTGPVMAFQDPAHPNDVGWIKFTVQNALNGEPINFTPPTDDGTGKAAADSANVTVLSYTDSTQKVDDLYWTFTPVGKANANDLLDPGETFEITCTSPTHTFYDALTSAPTAYTTFDISVKPPTGAALDIQRTIPASVDPVMNLN